MLTQDEAVKDTLKRVEELLDQSGGSLKPARVSLARNLVQQALRQLDGYDK